MSSEGREVSKEKWEITIDAMLIIGKYFEENGRLWVHMSVEVNHRTIDGIHIGKLKAAIDQEINGLQPEKNEKEETE